MTSWQEFERDQPDLADRLRAQFDAGRHKTIATLRADGSPRISGIECEFVDGELRFGSMPGARKADDLLRDPRFALHGPTVHPQEGREREWPGETKIAGHAVSVGPIAGDGGDDGPSGHLFVADIREVVFTHLDPPGEKLVVEWWTAGGGRRHVERT